jgi:hypothetical protein
MAPQSYVTIALSLYAAVLTYKLSLQPRVNALCARDFISPHTAEGTCLCGDGKYCLCTPSLAADVRSFHASNLAHK